MNKFFKVSCSRCGIWSKEYFYNMNSAVGLAQGGWRSFCNALYCPHCAKEMQNERGESFDIDTTIIVIMDEMLNQLEAEIRYLKGEYDD